MARVRIAPSPTGFFHLGNARTALFNVLFARKQNGAFVLRIEDTDKERSKKEYEHVIFESLKWLGIQYDEGPDIGGPYGPYRQSERWDIYRSHLEKLLEQDVVYRCFCTKEELEREREEQILAKQPPLYSGKCRKLSREERMKRAQGGQESVLRFAINPMRGKVEVIDLIRGKLLFDPQLIGDFVIAKNLDTPLYNFAVVVDDFFMKISHVIRGDDHISNTPKQILLCEALGFSLPQFAHLPMILNADKTKLSKRENEVSLLEYRTLGFVPEALVNFLALLGWNPGGDRELFTLSEMEELFDMGDVHKGGAIFDMQKLQWLNGMYIRKKDHRELIDLCVPYLKEAGYINEEGSGENRVFHIVSTGEAMPYSQLEKIVQGEKDRLKTLRDIAPLTSYFFQKELTYESELLQWKKMSREEAIQSLAYAHEVLEKISESQYEPQYLEIALKQMISERGLSNGSVLWPLRVALTGLRASRGLFDITAILGKEKTLQRIQAAKARLRDT